jgi:hypothetical protein
VLSLLTGFEEVTIETTRPDGRTRRTIIWVVVEGGQLLVRSVRGDRGHWYQAALDRPADVRLEVGGQWLPVRAMAATDDDSIARCSRQLAVKYAGDPSLPSMLRRNVLATTLRLEPR